jgi:hypothetical protein
MFEKSIHAMNNVGPTDNDNEENSIKKHSIEGNPTVRNGGIKKLNGKLSSKDPSSKSTCSMS